MKLSPAERRRIYEEEKTRLESEEKAEATKEPGSSTNLKPNVAGLLCYLGVWVTGIIFLIIERKNKSLRFHAMQSLVTFGILHIIIAIADTVRDWATWWAGTTWGWLFNPQVVAANVIFGVFIAISIVLWIVLMYQTYHGHLVRLPLFGDLARKLLAKLDGIKEEDIGQHAEYAKTEPEPPPSPVAKEPEATKDGAESYHEGTRHGRITSSAAAIAWSAIFLVFFNYFSKYFAIYSREAIDGITRWNFYPILTQDLNLVLPILNVTLILSIVGHSIIIALDRLDRYLLRQITLIVLNILGMITVLTFLRVFPFDFSVVPNTELAATLPTVAVVVMILITVGLGIGALVIFIKLIKRVAGCKKVKEV